ncbi:MAG: Crp/Fnr family transcriptional regulator [Alphaproteobacteria bacterium]|nr:Crp/Fnr family transcriptional regulator [Alphaproteobacteria bacterium]
MLSPLFSAIPRDSMEALVGIGEVKIAESGTVLVEAGKSARHIFLTLEGHVGAYTKGQVTASQLTELIAPGHWVGLQEALLNRPHDYAYVCFDQVKVLSLSAHQFLAILEKDWNFQRSMLGALSLRLHALVKQIHGLKTRSAEQRLAAHLLELDKKSLEDGEILLHHSKKDLASYLGMAPESLSRALHHMETYGVRTDGKKIWIDDPDRLRALIED